MKIKQSSTSALIGLALAVLCSQGLAQTTEIPDVIIDNEDARGISQSGVWNVSSGENPFSGSSVYSNSSGEFTWSTFLENGSYDLYAWWTYHSNRAGMVPYRLTVDTISGTDLYEFFVDQSDPSLGGQWNLLGTFGVFNRFGDGNIRVTVSSENGQANADAVKFEYQSPAKVWPESACICDEYYMRAIAIYTSLGGRMRPYSETDTEITIACNIKFLDRDARFTTALSGNQAGQSVQLWVDAAITDTLGTFECDARVNIAGSTVYSRIGGGSHRDIDVEACWASVVDLCTEN